MRPAWKILARGQQQIDRVLPLSAFRRRPRRVTALLERYIGHVRRFRRPLVLVMGLTAPADVWKPWFPGLEPRIEVMDTALKEMVARLDDPDVQFVEVWDEAEVLMDHIKDHWTARNVDDKDMHGIVDALNPIALDLRKFGYVHWVKITSKMYKLTDEG